MVAPLLVVSLALTWVVVPSAGLAQSSPADAGPPPSPAPQPFSPPGHTPPTRSQSPGAPFVTYAHALARGDSARACGQLSKVVLRKLKARSLRMARKVCAEQLGAQAGYLDKGRLRRLASTRIVQVSVNHRRARVTVQTTLYGIEPHATGTAIREDGRWKIAKLPSGAHVGRSLVERVPSESMVLTLHVGDTILVDRDAYRHAAPAIGDIVVFHPPAAALTRTHPCAKGAPRGQACAKAGRRSSKAQFVKRIVAGPGDRISIRHGHVIRNGMLAAEDFIAPCGPGGLGCDFPRTFTVAAGRYYMLGDNRGESDDSRYWGPVAAASIIGRVRRLGP